MGWTIKIDVDGTETEEVANKQPSLTEMQQFVGGYIEMVPLPLDGHERWMVVNEDGIMVNLPVNKRATEIFHEVFPHQKDIGGDIRGNAMILIDLQED